jgi:hypothetical protein
MQWDAEIYIIVGRGMPVLPDLKASYLFTLILYVPPLFLIAERSEACLKNIYMHQPHLKNVRYKWC